jgi:hypothetical protein
MNGEDHQQRASDLKAPDDAFTPLATARGSKVKSSVKDAEEICSRERTLGHAPAHSSAARFFSVARTPMTFSRNLFSLSERFAFSFSPVQVNGDDGRPRSWGRGGVDV